MTSWLVVWLVVALVSTVAVLVCVIGLVRHVLILGRTVRRLQEEVQPIADELSRGGERAQGTASSIGAHHLGGPGHGRRG